MPKSACSEMAGGFSVVYSLHGLRTTSESARRNMKSIRHEHDDDSLQMTTEKRFSELSSPRLLPQRGPVTGPLGPGSGVECNHVSLGLTQLSSKFIAITSNQGRLRMQDVAVHRVSPVPFCHDPSRAKSRKCLIDRGLRMNAISPAVLLRISFPVNSEAGQ